ncbi:MAG: type II secretion system protein [Acidobacteriota bacterium]
MSSRSSVSRRLVCGRSPRGSFGYTLTELVVVCVLLTILAAVTFPAARFTVRRQKEIELRRVLRTMRHAIDDYKRFSDAGLIPIELGTEGYPPDLETLVEGVDLVGQIDRKQKFLRRIPIDPMTGDTEWGLRSVQDDWDATSWGGENVYDVYSESSAVGLNGVPYTEW